MTPSATTVRVAIELSNTVWLVGTRLPSAEKPRMHRFTAGDVTGLLMLVAKLRARAGAQVGQEVVVVCCFEAGRDEFWLHRVLIAQGSSAMSSSRPASS